jgi:hypothetical protein
VPIVRSVSQRSGNSKAYFSANFALAAALSNETPMMAAFFASNRAWRSRNPQPSAVQPGVSALG